MSTEAQINAQKSTGPRTKVGKAVVAQNAIKHGLFAHQDVIAEEDPQQYEEHRRRFLAELSPAGEKQGLLAGRIVSLAWRLKRAERLQNELFDYLLAREIERSMDAFLDDMNAKDIKRMHESVETDPAYAVGRMIARDYRGAKTLDRMTLHERRLEGSLYRTMRELDRVQSIRGTCSAEQSQSDGSLDDHRQASLDAATQAATTDSAKQSQLETSGPGCGFAETQDIASLQAGDATCTATDESAEQSQSRPAGGMVIRPRARFGYHYHSH
jgi:hypothetical protein